MRTSDFEFVYAELADEQRLLTNREAETMMNMRNMWLSGSVCVLVATLALPISAGAFGRSPSESEALNQPGKMASAASMAGTDGGGAVAEKVPEPSSLLLGGIALGLGTVVAIWKRRRQTTTQEQAE